MEREAREERVREQAAPTLASSLKVANTLPETASQIFEQLGRMREI